MATPELNIDNVIGSGWFYEGITARYVKRWLNENAKASEIRVLINSPGGDVFHGIGIYNALKKFQGRVVVEVEALAASAASFIMMAGEEIQIHKGSFVMIHEPWTCTCGDATDHTRQAEFLSKVNLEIADIYAARTEQSKDDILAWLAEETWMTADEALERGFSDKTLDAKTRKKSTKRDDKAAKAVASSFRHAPAEVSGLLGLSPNASMLDRISSALADDGTSEPGRAPHAHTPSCGHPGICPDEQPSELASAVTRFVNRPQNTFPVAATPLGELAARTARIGG